MMLFFVAGSSACVMCKHIAGHCPFLSRRATGRSANSPLIAGARPFGQHKIIVHCRRAAIRGKDPPVAAPGWPVSQSCLLVLHINVTRGTRTVGANVEEHCLLVLRRWCSRRCIAKILCTASGIGLICLPWIVDPRCVIFSDFRRHEVVLPILDLLKSVIALQLDNLTLEPRTACLRVAGARAKAILLPAAAATTLREAMLLVIGRSDVQPPRYKIAASHRDRRLSISYRHRDVLLGLGALTMYSS